MKKFLSLLAIAAMISMAYSCSDDDDDDTAADDTETSTDTVQYAVPTITWESNPDFESQTMTNDMDIVLDVTAEAGIESFLLDIQSTELSTILTGYGISTTIDLVTDATMVVLINTICSGNIPYGSDVSGKTSLSVDISGLIPLILKVSEGGSTHAFVITVTDAEGQSTSATLTFTNDTPVITWESNPDFEQQTITSSMDIVVEVSAPSGIASFLLDIDSDVLSSVLTTYGLATSYELVTDDLTTLNAIMQLMGGSALPYGSDVEGATDVTIDISALVPLIASMGASSGSEHNFTITVTDVNELSSTATLSFVVE